jgi:glycosyltransferase involved in cell wall biosynthesis
MRNATELTDAGGAPRSVSGRALAQRSAVNGVDVIYVLNNLSLGGSEMKIVQVANALTDRGVRVGIAHLNAPAHLSDQLRPQVSVWHLERRGRISLHAVRALRRLIQRQRPGAVVAVNQYPTLYVVAASKLMRHKPRTVGLINTSTFRDGREWQRSFYRLVLSCLDWSVYGSELQRAQWLPARSAMRRRSGVIYNGVDLARYSQPGAIDPLQRASFGIGECAFVMGSVGRLAPEKNQAALIEALAELRRGGSDVHLLLIGDGRMRAALERKAAELGVEGNVTLAGALKDVRPALALMDVFVLPSLSVETFSNAALEAMASAKPVILSRIGGAAEMVRDGAEGFIVEPAELAIQVPRLIERLRSDPALCQRLGAAARRRVEREFSLDAMVDEYQALIKPGAQARAARCGHA